MVPVIVNDQDKAVMVTPGAPNLNFSINASSGVITGSFVPAGSKAAESVYGVVCQKQQSAFGYFRDVTQFGCFSLTPGS